MTQAYRSDETAIENQNDSKLSLEKKRISFTKNFSACDSRDSLFVCRWCTERSAAWRGLRQRQHRSCESNDAQRIPRGQCFSNEKRFPLFESCATAMRASIAGPDGRRSNA